MGEIEKQIRSKIRTTKIHKAILGTIATAGVIGVSLLAPNVLQALKMFNLDKKLLKNKTRSINRSREKLIEKGMLKYSREGFLTLTSLGQKFLDVVELNDYKLEKPKRWDKKWRVLIFDIKETKREIRDKVRNTLISIGFERLQNSVWVYPYDCEDFITLLKADFEIGKEVLYIVADKIENEKTLLAKFNLIF